MSWLSETLVAVNLPPTGGGRLLPLWPELLSFTEATSKDGVACIEKRAIDPAAIQLANQLTQLLSGCVFGERVKLRRQPNFCAGTHLVANVHF